MKQIGTDVANLRSSGPSLGALSKNDADKMLTVRKHSRVMPAISVRETDVEIPNRVWDSWIEPGKARKIRRALTDDERGALVKRRDELAPWVAGYHPTREQDEVALALIDLFTGFPSLVNTAESGAARVDSVARLLKDYPLWAIDAACTRARLRGYERDGKIERHWPPSDSEIVAMVESEVKLYAATQARVEALLKADVVS